MKIPDRFIGATGSLSGAASVLGSWQICHSVCIALIALLSAVGITVAGMPLAFLTKVAIPLWSIAVALLVVLAILAARKRCISRNLLIINTGLIVAGVPFQRIQPFIVWFWIAGGAIALFGILRWAIGRWKK